MWCASGEWKCGWVVATLGADFCTRAVVSATSRPWCRFRRRRDPNFHAELCGPEGSPYVERGRHRKVRCSGPQVGHIDLDLPNGIAGLRHQRPTSVPLEAGERHRDGDGPERQAGAVADRDGEGGHAILGLFDVEREPGSADTGQLASKRGELVGGQPAVRGVRIAPWPFGG